MQHVALKVRIHIAKYVQMFIYLVESCYNSYQHDTQEQCHDVANIHSEKCLLAYLQICALTSCMGVRN